MLLQGILLGISLSFLIGPLLFAIVEAGIGQGFRAGVSVAAGIWVSDMLYIVAALYGLSAMEALVTLPNFKTWAGLSGGLILALFGLGSFFKAQRQIKFDTPSNHSNPNHQTSQTHQTKKPISGGGYAVFYSIQ